MNWLEARFRRQFVQRGGDFVYRQHDREVLFDREDIDAFVAEWRELWTSPLVWGLMLLFGVVVPGGIWLWEPDAWVLAASISACSLGVGIWRLVDILYDVNRAAIGMESVGPGHGRPDYWPNPVLVTLLALKLFDERKDEFDLFLMWLCVAALIADPLYQYWKSRRHRARLALRA